MEQKHKQLLLKDLCARLPYGVKLNMKGLIGVSHHTTILYGKNTEIYFRYVCNDYCIDEVKPYLFPLSSMTDEQKEKYCSLQQKVIYNSKGLINSDVMEYINWCYKNHIDIDNLIPMGLANDATRLNIY